MKRPEPDPERHGSPDKWWPSHVSNHGIKLGAAGRFAHGAHGFVGQRLPKPERIPSPGNIGAIASAVLLPAVGYTAYQEVRRALREQSFEAKNAAAGSVAYLVSVGGTALKEGLEIAASSAAHKAAAGQVSKAGAMLLGRAGGRLVPGALSAGIAAADVVWAGTVIADDRASNSRKVAAGISAVASVVACAASNLPGAGTAVAAGAAAVSAGALILSNYL